MRFKYLTGNYTATEIPAQIPNIQLEALVKLQII